MIPRDPSAVLSVRVVPRSAKEGVAGFAEGVVRIRLNAPPVEGRANEALVRFLAGALGVSKGRIAIVAGETGRNKIVRVDGITRSEALDALGVRQPEE